MKTAFACWDKRIAPVFDTARRIHVVATESGRIVGETGETLSEDQPVQKALRLVELGIGVLVCGAISRPMYEAVASYGIQIIPFVAGDLRQVVRAWLQGDLERRAFAMPGCWGRGSRRFSDIAQVKEVMTMNRGGRGMGASGGRGQGGKGQGRGGQGGGGSGSGRGGRNLASGSAGYCVCPQCGQREPHQRGEPCIERKCPNCGAAMTRQ
ncbi:MAG: NifB/NifX family molybdenum-iron cluster-binding protein [Thermodesulfobacteriota bacterium]